MGWRDLEYYRNRGTQVHRAIHELERGELLLTCVKPEVVPFLEAYLDFREKEKWAPILTEFEAVSHSLRVVGHPDGLGTLDGEWAVPDFKTGAPGPTVGPQTAIYKSLINEMHEKYLSKAPLGVRDFKPLKRALGKSLALWEPRRLSRFSVHLGQDGKYKLARLPEVEDLAIYFAYYKTFQWEKEKGMNRP